MLAGTADNAAHKLRLEVLPEQRNDSDNRKPEGGQAGGRVGSSHAPLHLRIDPGDFRRKARVLSNATHLPLQRDERAGARAASRLQRLPSPFGPKAAPLLAPCHPAPHARDINDWRQHVRPRSGHAWVCLRPARLGRPGSSVNAGRVWPVARVLVTPCCVGPCRGPVLGRWRVCRRRALRRCRERWPILLFCLPAHGDCHLLVVVDDRPATLAVCVTRPARPLCARRVGEAWTARASPSKGRRREERLQDVRRLALERLHMLLTVVCTIQGLT